MKNIKVLFLLGLTMILIIFSCKKTVTPATMNITFAVAKIIPTEGNKATGLVTFTIENNTMHVKGTITGLKPGKHGFHIHEFGDLTKNDGTSAGGHFNPDKEMHAALTSEHRHEGDLGNLEAGKDGIATIDIMDSLLSFSGNTNIIGRGLAVHEKEDDFQTQPTGNSGTRIGVGVIGIGNVK
jgi:superoxide dismutase, Cu-Zn family